MPNEDLRGAKIENNGVQLGPDLLDKLIQISVESRIDMPAQAILEFADDDLTIIDGNTFNIGNSLKVSMMDEGESLKPVFEGEITSLEPNLQAQANATMRIEATTKLHRMHSGAKTKTWLNTKDSDIFNSIAGTYGLATDIEATPEVYEHVSQAAQSDWDFLQERARRIGYVATVGDGKLKVTKGLKGSGSDIELEWGKSLLEFRPRVMAASQPSDVKASYWDVQQKKEQTGTANGTDSEPAIGITPSSLTSQFPGATNNLVRWPAASPNDVTSIAEGARAALWSATVQAEGEAKGTPTLVAGAKVKVSGVGTKFGGTYLLSQVRHLYTQEGYRTQFEVRGMRSESFRELVVGGVAADGFDEGSRWYGVVPGVVSNIDDPDGLGRIKVHLPWLDSQYESWWARVAVPMSGSKRGMWFAPEVGDEVLVAFEHGDINKPYVVGFLWNGKENPPDGTVVAGKVERRVITSVAGHIISLVDKDGEEGIEIVDKTGKNLITIDSTTGLIKIEATDVEVEAQQNIKLHATNIEIKADANFKAEASANVDVTANAQMNLKANATLNAQASGPVAVKGAIINLN